MINYKAIQRAKWNELFLRGPVQFGWVRQNIPDPTSRLILVAEGFMGMSKPPASEVTLTGKLWNCAGILAICAGSEGVATRRCRPDLIGPDQIDIIDQVY